MRKGYGKKNNIAENQNLNNRRDAFSLRDAAKKFRKNINKRFEIDPLSFVMFLSFSWKAGLKITKTNVNY